MMNTVKQMRDLLAKNRSAPLEEVTKLLESSPFDPEVTFGGYPENLPVCIAARAHRTDILKMLIEKYHADVNFHFNMFMLPAIREMDLVPTNTMMKMSFHDYVILACCSDYNLCQEMLSVITGHSSDANTWPKNLLLGITQVSINEVDPRVLGFFLNQLTELPADRDGRTCLHYAAMRCGPSTEPTAPNILVIQELAKVRRSLNAFDDYGLTALQYATRTGSLAAVRALIAAGADVNAYWGPDSCTALHLAVAIQNVDVVHELLHAGARVKEEVMCDFVAEERVSISGDASDVARAAGNYRLARYLADPLRSSLGVLLDSAPGGSAAAIMFEPVPGEEVDGTCMICMEDTKLVPLGRCHHAFCKSCLTHWFNTSSNGVARPQCPHSGCNVPVSIYDIMAVLGKEGAERVDQLLLQRSLAEMPDFRWCPRCSNGGFFEGPCHSAECAGCGFKFCTECQQEAHEGMTCKEKTFLMVDSKCGTAKWMSQNTKRCPGCGVPITKNGGCSHMRCTRCRYEFCWFCLGKYQGVYTFEQRCPCPKKT